MPPTHARPGRECRTCGESLLTAMTRDAQSRYGYRRACKRCRAPLIAASKALYGARTATEIRADRARLRPDGLKRCRRCRTWLGFACYATDRTRADGLSVACRACVVVPLLRIALPRWEELDTWACVYCAAPFANVEHVWPVSDGGPDHPVNLVPACAPCNLAKATRPVLDTIAPDILAIVAGWHWRMVDLENPSGTE